MDHAFVGGILENERASALAHRRQLQRDFEGVVASSTASNGDDEHDPEGSTIAFERAQLAALLHETQASLDAVDLALAKLSRGDFGICEECHATIESERLSALPTARLCFRCASQAAPHA
jgi:RNA polymerase-binding transcription factor DksA